MALWRDVESIRPLLGKGDPKDVFSVPSVVILFQRQDSVVDGRKIFGEIMLMFKFSALH